MGNNFGPPQIPNILSTYDPTATLPGWGGSGNGSAGPPMGRGGGAAGGGGFNPLGIFGGSGRGGGGGLLGNLKNLKGINWGGFTHSGDVGTPGVNGQPGVDQGASGGSITGVSGLLGQGLTAGGMMLASHGLLGNSMGTWSGTAQGALGGAAVGFAMGGPIGAAIGGGVGLAIGLGEQIAGVESPAHEAARLVKSIYGVSIPENSGTIKQIVSVAQSQYGGTISVAVRSPSVRQLVQLYSEATGQHMPLSATTPYGGNLVEQGGKLYQQASYQDGMAHVYNSSLPTLGGLSTTNYPTPGGAPTGGAGMSFALNINGTPITPEFVADQSLAAQGSAYGRTQQAANLTLPGLMVA